jgi:hypothetical protein
MKLVEFEVVMGLHSIFISFTLSRKIFNCGIKSYGMIGVTRTRRIARALPIFIIQSASYPCKQYMVKYRILGNFECTDEGVRLPIKETRLIQLFSSVLRSLFSC